MADARRWVWLGGIVLLCVFVFLLHSILTPFLVALLLAYLFDPVVDRLEKAGLSRTLGVVAVFALFTLIITALVLVLVPMLAKQLFRLYELAPQMLDWLQHTAMPWAQAKLGLADGFWKRRFGADPRIVGRQLRLDGEMTTVVGVLNSHVDTAIFSATPDSWIPLQLDANSTSHPPSLIAAARLRPGATLAGAQAEARVVGEAFHRRFPDASGPNDTFTVVPFQNAMVQNVLVAANSALSHSACADPLSAGMLLFRAKACQPPAGKL